VIASFLAPLVYLIARRLTGDERISKMSGLLTAFCMSLIYISVVLEPESLMIPCLWLFLLLVTRYGEGGRVPAGLPLLAGGTFGLMNGTRSVMSLFIVCVAAWLFAFVRTMNVRTKLAHALVLVLATVALTAPAQLMCSSRKDDLTKSGSSFVLSPAASTYHCDNSELARMGFNPFSSIPKSFEIFVNDPVRVGYLFLKAAASNTHRFFFLNFFGYFNPFILVVPSKYYNPFGAYMLFYMYAFMLAGGYLLLFSRRVKREMAHLLLFLFIYYVVTHPVFFVMMNARYRTPLHPLFIILFSMGFYHVRDRLKAGGAA
jgi:hypothetical protein